MLDKTHFILNAPQQEKEANIFRQFHETHAERLELQLPRISSQQLLVRDYKVFRRPIRTYPNNIQRKSAAVLFI